MIKLQSNLTILLSKNFTNNSPMAQYKHIYFPNLTNKRLAKKCYYERVQSFRVHSFFTGQYYTEEYITFTDVI